MLKKAAVLIFILIMILAVDSPAAVKKATKSTKKTKITKIAKPAVKAPIKTEIAIPVPQVKTEPKPPEKITAANNDEIKIGGQIFFRWQKYTAKGGTNVNNFDIDRAYINLTKKLDRDAAARLTLDVARLDTSKLDTNKKGQNLYDFLKYAYVELPVNIPAQLQPIPFNSSAKLGLQQTVWIDWEDKIMNLRWIAKSLLDNEGIMPSADFGISAAGKISPPFMPEVEYQTGLFNGSGYKSAETDGRKNFSLRLNSTIYDRDKLGKVIVGVLGSYVGINFSGADSLTTKQVSALAVYKHDLGTVYGEYLYGTGISGYSIGGIYQVLTGINVFARFDDYAPSRSIADDQIDRSFYGITCDWGRDIKFALDLQNTTGGSAASTSAGTATSILYLHALINI